MDFNKASGVGIQIHAENAEYIGEFLGNKFEGYGKISYRGGFVYQGEFRGGEFGPFGKCIYSDGSYYIGEFKDGVRSGKGILYCNEYKIIGHWRGDRLEGEAVIQFNRSKGIEKVKFERGKCTQKF